MACEVPYEAKDSCKVGNNHPFVSIRSRALSCSALQLFTPWQMSWLLTWFLSVGWRTSEFFSYHAEAKGGTEYYHSDPLSALCHHGTPPFLSLWPPMSVLRGSFGQEVGHKPVISPSVYQSAIPSPHYLCQLPAYCLSSLNPFFFALLCDVGSGLCEHFSFAGWLNVRLCQWRALKGHFKAIVGGGASPPISSVH